MSSGMRSHKHVPAGWRGLAGGDPVPWLLDSAEPAAGWVALTGLLDRAPDESAVQQAHREVAADSGTRELVGRLPDWAAGDKLSGHNSPAFAPNLLILLADMGVGAGDFHEVDRLLDAMLVHQEESGRFPSYGAMRASEAPVWGALLCDSHAVLGVLVRFGREDDDRVKAGLERMAADITDTAQGRAWPCLPHSTTGWRGPGRQGDFCPMVTLQALRTFARLAPSLRPDGLLDTARVALRAWRVRGTEKPYQFGHGLQFKSVKWPQRGTARTRCSTPWADTPNCGETVRLARTSRLSRRWSPVSSNTTFPQTAPSLRARHTAASRGTRSDRRSSLHRSQRRCSWPSCTGLTTSRRTPSAWTSWGWVVPRAARVLRCPRRVLGRRSHRPLESLNALRTFGPLWLTP